MIQAVETGNTEEAQYEGDYSGEEFSEILSVSKKLMRIRETILRVNQESIRSAAQEDAYRTEPSFKLQGSYRNMNRLAEKVAALMTDEEVEQLLRGDGEQDPISRILSPLMAFSGSVEEISDTLKGASQNDNKPNENLAEVVKALEAIQSHMQASKEPATPIEITPELSLPESASERLDEILLAFRKMLNHTKIEE